MDWWSRLSLSAKLPIALGVIFVAATATMTAAMFSEVRATVLAVASSRLEQAARQLADSMATTARQRLAQLEALSELDGVAAVAAAGSALPGEAQAQFTTYLGPAAATASLEVWGPAGDRRFAAGQSFEPLGAEVVTSILAAETLRVSPLQQEGDSLGYTVSAPLREQGRLVGLLVERRHLANQPQNIALLSGLIGGNASILIGNRDGTRWTDLEHQVRVDISERDADRLLDYQRPGRPRVMARAMAVAGTPWMAVVELPYAPVVAPVNRVFRRALAMAAMLLAAVAVIGWAATRRVTAPLRRLTAAAQDIAEGRPGPHVEARGDDELGRLVDCFNAMARRVEESRRRYEDLVGTLEQLVATRTTALQEANRELEAFSYSVSHDLRAPLRAIAGFARILSEDARQHLPPESQATLEVIERNTRQMGMLIDDLLEFSRLSRQSVAAKPVDMTTLAADVAKEIQRSEDGRHLRFDLGNLPPAVGDRSLLRQVFANLLQNAVKFTRRRADATVAVGALSQGQETAYFVRDNGVGFDMQYVDKLFKVFQRLHRAEDFEGTGVGLAIVQRIVHRHGGRVWAEGALEQGATFYFTIPHDRSDP